MFFSLDDSEISIDNSELSPWWDEARKILSSASQPLKALTATYVCRGAGLKLETKLESKVN